MPRTRSSAKDEAITRATIALLLETGYARLRMEAVAARAAVSKRTLYKRFADKESLISAVAEQLFAHLRQTSPRAPCPQEDILSALVAFAERVVDFLLDPTVVGVLRVVVAESHMHPALGAAFVEHGKRPLEQALADYLRGCRELDVEAPNLAAAQFLGMVKEVLVWPQVLSPGAPLTPQARHAAIKSTVQSFLRAHAR